MEMEKLLEMGFPVELAAKALSATGGKSVTEAAEWILTRDSIKSTPIPLIKTPFQAKINRFFPLNPSKRPPPLPLPLPPPPPPPPVAVAVAVGVEDPPLKKRKPNRNDEPLAERMRPRTVDQIVGQDHLLSDASLLRSAIDYDRLLSLILWGPPGTGKTSIARAIVNSCSSSSSYRFVSLSAVSAGVKDVRDVVDEARKFKTINDNRSKRTVLFVDEVHRFNKSQLDSFLPVIDDGSIVFVGATTENPSFHLTTPLLSRCRVLTLNPLQPDHVATLLRRSTQDPDKGLALSLSPNPNPGVTVNVNVSEEVIGFLSQHCDGDARVALNALEISAITAAARLGVAGNGNSLIKREADTDDETVNVTVDDAKKGLQLQTKNLAYGKHNLIAALDNSMRGSDADASIYWLARMLEGGEEPLYIARRLVRFASEDVGLGDPLALPLAVSCYQACRFLGMPECTINLSHCVAYLAVAPKSIAVYRALEAAKKVVRESGGQNEGVPLHLRNAPTKLMKDLGYAKGYVYPPDNPSASRSQSYLPPSLQGCKFLDWPKGSASAADRSDKTMN